jgi:DNA-binding winged helix-turn-helix (wHTH) protein/tetratricopeptide (TPR) repeat protein
MPATSYRFGPYAVDRSGYRMFRGTEPLNVTPKLLDLLLYLLDHAGTLVTKEELLDALWPGANVTENALAQAVSELRQALGDEAGAPQFIKTVARRGYRFIAPVETIEAPVPTRREPSPAPSAAPADDQTIAVLDFVNVTGDPEAAWLSPGIAETVTSDLRALGPFRVVERWRVTDAARRTDGSLEQIARDVRARLAVLGSVQRNGNNVRITARLVDVVTGEALADAKVDGPVENIFALQDEIVGRFARDLGLTSTRAGGIQASARETSSLQAYRAFSEASLRLESLDVREMPQAIADFERAVAADSRYALAYAGLASAEFALYETTRSDNEPAQDVLDRAAAHARRAVQLDDTLGEAHATLALILVSLWHTREALASARRAVALEPGNWRHLFRLGHASWGEERLRAAERMLAMYPEFAFAHFQAAMVHVARGHLHAAETVLRQGAAVQDRQIGRGGRYPALGLHWLLGLVRLAADDVEEAVAEFEREQRLAEPHRLYGREYAMHAHHARGAAWLRAGRLEEARESFASALSLYPDHAPSHLGLALVLRTGGSIAKQDAPLQRAAAASATLVRTRPIEAALVRAQLLAAEGKRDEAVIVLNRLIDSAPPGFAAWTLPVEPFLRELGDTPGFGNVLARLADRAR